MLLWDVLRTTLYNKHHLTSSFELPLRDCRTSGAESGDKPTKDDATTVKKGFVRLFTFVDV